MLKHSIGFKRANPDLEWAVKRELQMKDLSTMFYYAHPVTKGLIILGVSLLTVLIAV